MRLANERAKQVTKNLVHPPFTSCPPPFPVQNEQMNESLTLLLATEQLETNAESVKVKAKTLEDVGCFRTRVSLSSQTRHQLVTIARQKKRCNADVSGDI